MFSKGRWYLLDVATLWLLQGAGGRLKIDATKHVESGRRGRFSNRSRPWSAKNRKGLAAAIATERKTGFILSASPNRHGMG